MMMEALRAAVTRHPAWVIGGWVGLALVVGLAAPDLTRLAAEGQAHLLHQSAESARAAELIRKAWPEQSFESQVVVALHRPSGLVEADRAYVRGLADRFAKSDGRPAEILRILGPASDPTIASRLISRDGTTELIMVPLAATFVAPSSEVAVAWLHDQAEDPGLKLPAGLKLFWTGDAAIGHDYMRNVQVSLDRAAMATVVLLMGVLMVVYRSFWLTLVPLVTIGLCVVISRGLLAWAATLGWEMSPLV